MVWDQLFASTSDNDCFAPQLLECIKENKEKCAVSFQNAKNLSTTVDSSGSSLLHYAAEFGNEILIQFLIESGAKVDLQNEKGQTPLILATREKHEEAIRVLLKNKADIYIEDENGVSALQLAVQKLTYTNPDIMNIFFDKLMTRYTTFEIVAKRLLKVNFPLPIAVRLYNMNVVKFMLSEGAPIDATEPELNHTALHVSVNYDKYEIVKLLIDQGANVNIGDIYNRIPIAMIRNFKDLETLKLLVNNGSNLTTCTNKGIMQVYWVFSLGTSEAVKIIIQSGFDFYTKDLLENTVVHYLAKNVNKGIIDLFEKWIDEIDEKFIDWNARNIQGRTPLHIAMAAGNVSFVEYLIRKNADVNARDNPGFAPVFEILRPSSESTLEQRLGCLEIIMQAGAVFDIHQSIAEGVLNSYSCEAVGVLLHVGLDFQARCSKGQTVLHHLANNVNKGIVEILRIFISANNEKKQSVADPVVILIDEKDTDKLVYKSINWNATDKNGRTPLHIAMAVGNVDFVGYLIEKHVDLNVKSASGLTPFFEALESSKTSRFEQRVVCVELIMENGAYSDVEIKKYLEKYNENSVINRDFAFLKPVLAELVIHEAKRERISEKLFESIFCHPQLKNYVVDCQTELKLMKEEKLSPMNSTDKPVNLFDFLTEASDNLEFYKSYSSKLRESIVKYKFESYYLCKLMQRHYKLCNLPSNTSKWKILMQMIPTLLPIILVVFVVILMMSTRTQR